MLRVFLIPTLAAVFFGCLTLYMGLWQWRKADAREAEQHALESRLTESARAVSAEQINRGLAVEDWRYRRVEVRGTYVAQAVRFVDNRVHAGSAGFHVITPLTVTGAGPWLLVDRGWIARGASYPKPPDVATPSGEVALRGVLAPIAASSFALSSQTEQGSVWQNLKAELYSKEFGRDIAPLILHLDAGAPGALLVELLQPGLGFEKNRGYAYQWFAMAATIVILYVVLTVRYLLRRRKALAP